jgi:hypothetical protein
VQDTALSDQIPLALISTYALQWLKASKFFPWLTMETQTLNRIVGIAIAFLTSVGVLVSFDHVAGVLTVTGLTLANLGHAVIRFGQQWTFQQASYRLVVAPAMPGAMQAGAAEHPPVLAIEPEPVKEK